MNRLVAFVLAVTALVACTAATNPAPSTPSASPRVARVVQPLTPTAAPIGVVMTAAPTYLAGSQHAAFPSLSAMPDGRMRLEWRQGSDHVAARDGRILATTLDSWGQNPGPVETVLSQPGVDFRDPSVSYLEVGGTVREYRTYFTGTPEAAAQGAMVTVDGGPPVRIDPNLPRAAISAPVVKLPDGKIATAFYGRKVGESVDTAFMAWSSDGGQSWTTNRIINIGIPTPEPWLVVDGPMVHMFSRWGDWDSIAVRSSPDSGVTWGPVRRVTTNGTGRPTTIATSGVLIMVCRLLPSKSAQVIYSLDHSATWAAGPTVLTAPPGSPLGMTYGAMAVVPGPVPLVRLVVGMEQADGSSALYATYLAVSVQ